MLIRRALTLAVALLAAGPTAALTCFRPTIADTYAFSQADEQAFVIALGTLERTGPDIPDGPPSDNPNNRVGYSFAAQFDGRFLENEGVLRDRNVPVTVEVTCIAAWCGHDSLSDDGLYFLRQETGGTGPVFALEAGPCPLNFFPDPGDAGLLELLALID